MDIKYIAEFVTLAKVSNYLEAAEQLFISQSSLSKHIQVLEKELGVSLFDRTTRHVRLSQDGKLFLNYSEKITALMNEYHQAAATLSKQCHNTLAIASTSQMVYYNIADALAEYKRKNLNCSLDVIIESHHNLKKLLYDQKADFIWIGETEAEAENDDFCRIPYIDDVLVALVPHGHKLSGYQKLSLEVLSQETLLMQDNSSIEQKVFIEFSKARGFAPGITSLPITTLIDFARQGLGIAVILESVSHRLSCPECSPIALEESPVFNINLLYLKTRRLTPVSRKFLEFYEEWMKM